MKKYLLSIFFVLVIGTVQAGYLDSGYSNESEMSEDVSLLAQASLLYKTGGEIKAYKSAQRICKGIDIKVSKTSYLTESMKRWKRKVDQICLDY